MKKLITILTVAVSFLFASPTFAYTVKNGDTMTKIAKENNLSLQDLSQLNPQVQNLDLIYIGQTVFTDKQGLNSTLQEKETSKPEVKGTESVGVVYSDNEIDLLARLVRAEAESEPYQGKVAVACVVLNRVDSPKFPNSIKGVIYQKGQFQPTRNGQINKPADEDSINAVHEALKESRKLVADSLFFYNPTIATSRWLDSRETTLAIGHHVFKK